jgi:hypothetical protein
MPIIATQPISSGFGTYMPGDEITVEAAGPVLEAWLAAGIAVNEEEPTVAEIPKPIERATQPKRETAVGRRQAETPHKRFQTGEAPPQRRFQQETS